MFSPTVSAIMYSLTWVYVRRPPSSYITSCSAAPRVPVVRSLPGSCIRGVCCQRVIRKTIDHSCCPGSHSFDDVVKIPRDAATRAPQEFRRQRRLGTYIYIYMRQDSGKATGGFRQPKFQYCYCMCDRQHFISRLENLV